MQIPSRQPLNNPNDPLKKCATAGLSSSEVAHFPQKHCWTSPMVSGFLEWGIVCHAQVKMRIADGPKAQPFIQPRASPWETVFQYIDDGL
jgi:hypothetical protein